MMTTKKLILRSLAFLVVFGLVFWYFSGILASPRGGPNGPYYRIKALYKEPQNSLDVVYIGTSAFDRSISPLTMFEEQGFSSFVRATPAQNPIVMYYYLRETLQYQQPKVVVLGASILFNDRSVDGLEGLTRLAVDPLRMSLTKLQLIRQIIIRSEKQSAISYLLPLFRYHARWSELTKNDFVKSQKMELSLLKGFMPVFGFPGDPVLVGLTVSSARPEELSGLSSEYLKSAIALCRENGVEPVLLVTPRSDWTYAKYLAVSAFAREQGVTYIDYNLPENLAKLGLDFGQDFFDAHHLNANGALKFSHVLGQTLQESYHFPDKRQDPAFAQWNQDVLTLQAELEAGWAGPPTVEDSSGSAE